jgi:hypothetical protein
LKYSSDRLRSSMRILKNKVKERRKRNYSVDLLYSCSVCVGGTIFRGSKQKQYFPLFCVPEGGRFS